MRNVSLCLLTIFLVPLFATADTTAGDRTPGLVRLWASDAVLKVPESVLFHASDEVLFVANINGQPTEKNGEGFISRLGLDGNVEVLRWAIGLDAPKGMGISGGKLYVTDIDRVVAIDLASGKIVDEFPVPGSGFLNDIAVGEDGSVFVSDMAPSSSAIHRITEGEISKWIDDPEISSPNGLFAEKDRLIVGNSGGGNLKAVDFASRRITVVAETGAGIDGVEGDGSGGYFISDWRGATSWVSPSGEVTKLLDTRSEEVQSADIEYSREK